MSVAQLNVRLDADLKREGDAALARNGASATDAVRSLWRYMARTQALPIFMQDNVAQDASAEPEQLGIGGAGMAIRLAGARGICAPDASLSYDELRETAFEEAIAEGRFHA